MTTSNVNIDMISTLMQDYRNEMPVSGKTEFAAVKNADGELDLYGISTDKKLVAFLRDPESETGWIQVDTGINAWTLVSIPQSNGPDKLYIANIIININEQICKIDLVARTGQAFTTTKYASAGISTPIEHISYLDGTQTQDGDVLVATLLPNSGPINYFYFTKNDAGMIGLADNYLQVSIAQKNDTPLQSFPHLTFATTGRDGKVYLYWGSTVQHKILELQSVSIPSCPGSDNIIQTNALFGPDNKLYIFAMTQEGKFYNLKQTSNFDIQAPPIFEPSWQATDVPHIGPKQISFQEFKAIFNNENLIEIYVLDTTNKLWSIIQDPQTVGGWTPFVDLGVQVAHFTIEQNKEKLNELFGVSSTGSISWLRQDEEDDWDVDQIEITSQDNVILKNIYRCSLNIINYGDTASPLTPVKIVTETVSTIYINDLDYIVGPDNPIYALPNSMGALAFVIDVEDTFDAPKIDFSADWLDMGCSLEPDLITRDYLGTISEDTLKNAQAPDGVPVVPEDRKQDTAQIAESIRQAMALPNASPTMKPWRFSVREGAPLFEYISREEFNELYARGLDQKEALRQVLQAKGFFDFLDDVGDFFESAWDEVCDVVDIVVDEVKCVVTLVIDGVDYVFSAIASAGKWLYKEAYGFVRTILDAIGTVWGTVLGWVIKAIGWLFGLEDISKVRDEIKKWVQDGMKQLPSILPPIDTWKEKIDNWLDIDFDAIFGQVASSPTGQTEPQTLRGTTPIDKFFVASDRSFYEPTAHMSDKFINSLGSANVTKYLKGLGDDPIPGLTDKMESLIGVWLGSPTSSSFNEAIDTFTSQFVEVFDAILDTASSFMDDPVSTLFTLLENALKAFIDILKALLDSLLDIARLLLNQLEAVFSALDEEIDIPFFTAFYKAAFGGTCSLLDIICLMLAVPVVLYRRIVGETNKNELGMEDKDIAILVCLCFWAPINSLQFATERPSFLKVLGLASGIIMIIASIIGLTKENPAGVDVFFVTFGLFTSIVNIVFPWLPERQTGILSHKDEAEKVIAFISGLANAIYGLVVLNNTGGLQGSDWMNYVGGVGEMVAAFNKLEYAKYMTIFQFVIGATLATLYGVSAGAQKKLSSTQPRKVQHT